MKKLNQKLVAELIEEVEKETQGEIMTVVMKKCDGHPVAHFRLGLIISFLATVALYFLDHPEKEDIWYLYAQVAGFFLGHLLAFIPAIKRVFVSRGEMDDEFRQRMMESFLSSNLHHTKKRTGVLIFVSLFERRAEILADKGINDVVSQETWESIMHKVVEELRVGEIQKGLMLAVKECGAVLKENFPLVEGEVKENELPDEVVFEGEVVD